MIESGPLLVDDGELRMPPGTVVAGAVVEGEMARGGMAIVYRALCEDGTKAVLKVGTAEAAVRPGVEQRYRNEERLGARLRHPNIVRPLAVGRLEGPSGFEGRMFLMTRYVDAPSLSHFMMYHADGVPLEQLWSIGRQLASALVAMHDVGIVHRDIKPDNILVGDDGHVHVIDFGLAFSLGDVGDEERSEDLTLAGDAPGTPLYMSPQQAMHQPISRCFDIYALGVLLYEMCCGSAPHEHLPLREIAAARSDASSKPLSLTIMAPRIPESLVTMIERCMAYEPEQRPTAAQVLAFFESEAPRESATDTDSDVSEERTTAPELRVVRLSSDPEEVSDSTRLVRHPSLVAEQSGEGAADLPSVRRVCDDLTKVDRGSGSLEPRAVRMSQLGSTVRVLEEASHAGVRPARLFRVLVAAGLLLLLALGGWVVLDSVRSQHAAEVRAIIPALAIEDELAVEEEAEIEPPPSPRAPVEPPSPKVEPEAAAEPVVERERPKGLRPEKTEKNTRRPAGSGQKKTAPPVGDANRRGPETTCAAHRVEAKNAGKSKRWKAVLAATEDASCWPSGVERVRLRAKALMSLGRYKACMRETAGQEAPDLAQIHGDCFRRASGEEP